jgi:hypothetical protein
MRGLVDVAPEELESVLNEFALRFRVAIQDYFHNIEPVGDLRIIEHAQPDLRATGDLPYLEFFDVVDRPAQILVSAGFYFDEHQRVAIATNHINFTAAAVFEVAVKDLVTALSQKPAGRILAAAAANMFWIAR